MVTTTFSVKAQKMDQYLQKAFRISSLRFYLPKSPKRHGSWLVFEDYERYTNTLPHRQDVQAVLLTIFKLR